MAVNPSTYQVSDICLGKPGLWCLSGNLTTIADALSALRRSGETYLSVWTCDHSRTKPLKNSSEECVCIGKVCLGDIICFLAKENKLKDPSAALGEPIIEILHPSKAPSTVRHLEPHASLLEAIDLVLEGAQNIVIPIHSPTRRKLNHDLSSNTTVHDNYREYCWLTQEDIIRNLLNSIYLFSAISNKSIEHLGLINTNSTTAVHYDAPAASVLPFISQSIQQQTAVAVLNDDNKIIGEISHATLNACDETVAAAIATLTVGELVAYIDGADPPEEMIQMVKERLEGMNLMKALELFDDDLGSLFSSSSYSSSDDDESCSGKKLTRSLSRTMRSRDPVVCYPWSSLIAVMIMAISHRLGYLWVVEEDGTVIGIVTYAGMLQVFRERLKSGF